MNKVLLFIILFVPSIPISGQIGNSNVKLRIKNDSKYLIESFIISYDGTKTEFKNIKSQSFSEIVDVNGFWMDKSYEITFRRARIIGNNSWINIKKLPIDHIGDIKKEKGEFTISIKIDKTSKTGYEIEIIYLDNKTTPAEQSQ